MKPPTRGKRVVKEVPMIRDMIYEIIGEIRELKESTCENSGLNWWESFMARYSQILPAPQKVTKPKPKK